MKRKTLGSLAGRGGRVGRHNSNNRIHNNNYNSNGMFSHSINTKPFAWTSTVFAHPARLGVLLVVAAAGFLVVFVAHDRLWGGDNNNRERTTAAVSARMQQQQDPAAASARSSSRQAEHVANDGSSPSSLTRRVVTLNEAANTSREGKHDSNPKQPALTTEKKAFKAKKEKKKAESTTPDKRKRLNESKHQQQQPQHKQRKVVVLTNKLILQRDASPSASLFYSSFHQHKALRPIGEIGRRKYSKLNLWWRDENKKRDKTKTRKFQRELLPYSVDEQIWRRERNDLLEYMDDLGGSDDDLLRFEERDYPRDCVRPSWTDLQFPVCNTFHELQTETTEQDWRVRYLAHGYYRDSFLLESQRGDDAFTNSKNANVNTKADAFVWKRIRYKEKFSYGLSLQSQIRTEALIMERLSGSHRTTTLYGYCATSLAVEVARDITQDIVPFTAHQTELGRISQENLEKLQKRYQKPIFSFNNFTIPEKLELAIAVAEGIAEMHGYRESVMVNDDVHPDQWLITADGRIILNDMNNAVFLEWDFENEEYCPYYSSYGGDFRAPEEYVGSDVDESVDIYPMANMIFSILTGLWPWYELPYDERRDLQAKAIRGDLPYINPLYRTHSFIEGRLVELMELCYVREPTKRPDIFFVVQHLHETRRRHREDLDGRNRQPPPQANER